MAQDRRPGTKPLSCPARLTGSRTTPSGYFSGPEGPKKTTARRRERQRGDTYDYARRSVSLDKNEGTAHATISTAAAAAVHRSKYPIHSTSDELLACSIAVCLLMGTPRVDERAKLRGSSKREIKATSCAACFLSRCLTGLPASSDRSLVLSASLRTL